MFAGYKCVIYMPDTQSQGKIDLLRLLGAEVYPVPAGESIPQCKNLQVAVLTPSPVAFENPENYNHQAKRHAGTFPSSHPLLPLTLSRIDRQRRLDQPI